MSKIIVGHKVKLRKAVPGDAELLCKWYADGRVMVHVGFADGFREDLEKLRQKLSNQVYDSGLFIILNEKDEPIGECNFKDLIEAKCSIGIKICELEFQGKGYGKDAFCAFIDYLFTAFLINFIELDTLVENIRAQNMYKKIGFKETRINKDCWVDPTGKSRSAVEMTLIKDDFYIKDESFKG